MQGQAEPALHYFIYWRNSKDSPEGDASVWYIFNKFTAVGSIQQIKSKDSFKIIVIFPSKDFIIDYSIILCAINHNNNKIHGFLSIQWP